MNTSEFLRWEAMSRDVIDVKRIYIDIAGDLVAGILLSQIIYWHLPGKNTDTKLRINKEGKMWLAKGREDWWDECRITARQFDRAINILINKGLIEKKIFKFKGTPQVHIHLHVDVLLDEIKKLTKEAETPDNAGFYTKGEMDFTQSVKSILRKGENPFYTKGKIYNIDHDIDHSKDNNKEYSAVVDLGKKYDFNISTADWLIKELVLLTEDEMEKVFQTMEEVQKRGKVNNPVGALRKNTNQQIKAILAGTWYAQKTKESKNNEYDSFYISPDELKRLQN